MKTSIIPEGYQRIMVYLIIENATAFSMFTQKVFGAVEKLKFMRTETLIMHAEINIAGSCIMFADATEQYKKQTAGLYIFVDDCDSTYQKALENGAIEVMAPANQAYDRRVAGVRDPFENTWWIVTAI
jgi:PhnB protein